MIRLAFAKLEPETRSIIMTEKPRAKPKVALVIGSGSVKCAASLGLLKVLERENIFIDMVVGCSGGSIYAAAIALG